MPQNDSHIVELECWRAGGYNFQCNGGGPHQRTSHQPMMQLKFLSANGALAVEWGEVRLPSEDEPLQLAVKDGSEGTWTLKGRLTIRHQDITVVGTRGVDGALRLLITKPPSLRWGEQTYNPDMKRNNRTQWQTSEPLNAKESRWPNQYKAITDNCSILSLVPKQKHLKKLEFLALKLIESAPRMEIIKGSAAEMLIQEIVENEEGEYGVKSGNRRAESPSSFFPKGSVRSSPKKSSPLSTPSTKRKANRPGLVGKKLPRSMSPRTPPETGAAKRMKTGPVNSRMSTGSPSSMGKNGGKKMSMSTPAATKRRHSRPAAASSAAQLGLTVAEYKLLQPEPWIKSLGGILYETKASVSTDWAGTGSAAQAECLVLFFETLARPLQAVIDTGVKRGVAFSCCHELLLTVSKLWSALKAIPMPGGVSNVLASQLGQSGHIKLFLPGSMREDSKDVAAYSECITVTGINGHVDFALTETWRLLLVAAAEKVDKLDSPVVMDDMLFKCIKDVVDFCPRAEQVVFSQLQVLPGGSARLMSLFNQRQRWSVLPSCNIECPFDTPMGGSMMTLEPTGNPFTMHSGDYIRCAVPHIRDIQRSDSWDSILEADDSQY